MYFVGNPTVSFWVGLVTTICTAVVAKPELIHHAFPDSWVPWIVSWDGLVAIAGSAYITASHGFANPVAGPFTHLG
jgi:hypothetical protein